MARRPRTPKPLNYYETVTAAIADMTAHGFDNMERVSEWVRRIREAAERELVPLAVLEKGLADTLRGVYRLKVDGGAILRNHPGVQAFTLERIKPALRAELDRRIMASADLIRLNREAAIQDTLQRFSGWATSIPAGGTDVAKKREISAEVRKSLTSLPFRERRVAIDQAHKFTSNLSEIIATDTGALAGIWHSNWRQLNYNYREDHKERDQKVYVVRGNWALEKGLMKVDGHKYTDDITKPGEEVFCRCHYRWVYGLRSLPPDMLTDKGKAELQRVRAAMAA